MEKTLYAIRSYPSASILDVLETRDEARDTIAAWEELDMDECTYSPGRYYITEISQNELDQIEAVQQACTTDCIRYRQGTCPYWWPDKWKCPNVRRYFRAE